MREFIFVVGSTASGKSEWALREAAQNSGVIFNCDSIQLYQDVNIGSAKPSKEDREKVPHYLFDIIPPPQEITSGDYRDLFLSEVKKIPSSVPIYVVGGTGFYFLALEKGLYEIEEASNDLKLEIEKQAGSKEGLQRLMDEIQNRDPEYAQKLHLHDQYRIIRAVEILRSNPSKTITQLAAEKKQARGLDGSIRKVGIRWSPSDLENRIRQRTKKMLEEGLIEETDQLLKRGFEGWAPLRSVGYKEVAQYINGEIPRGQLEEQIVISTRQLAKKQRTWFQRDPEIEWLSFSK